MKLEELLSQRGLILQSPSPDEIRKRARILFPESIKLFYGETYDHVGNTIDSMKYYFFVANLAQVLKDEGYTTDPVILIANTAACRNVGPDLQYKYSMLGESRASFVEDVNKIYNTKLRVVKMSDYIYSQGFQKELKEIIEICEKDKELMRGVEKTVPESKIEIEREKGFAYSFDEIATIIGLDVKVGPPREDFYDNIARKIAERKEKKQLMSLFLTPTFPIGMNWAYFFANEGIEEHGITAYKGGSKRLQDHRIIIGRSSINDIKEQLDKSFISIDSELPNPVLDIGIICEMAKKRLENDNSPIDLANKFYQKEITSDQLKEKVGNDVERYILSRF